jgi:catechol 2,3-dioxygenase-like lactoylglutathione lyase family enzyme
MKRIPIVLLALSVCLSSRADQKHPRPRILGISHVKFYSTNIARARGFYSQVLRPEGTCLWCEQIPQSPLTVFLSASQRLTLSTLSNAPPSSLLYEIDFAVDDVSAMKNYLADSNVALKETQGKSKGSKDLGDTYLAVIDPEGHRVGFVHPPATASKEIPGLESVHLIHAGFVVHDRAAEDKFYKDILGFHVYWHGGMKEGDDNWVDMQVPDGTDWLEYMLKVPENATYKQLGVMNHIALGVPDIHAAQQRLIKNGWKGTEEPKIGRDGKWQLNLYDPDETRVELMEFKPTKEPCCSPYTGPHPGPTQ